MLSILGPFYTEYYIRGSLGKLQNVNMRGVPTNLDECFRTALSARAVYSLQETYSA